MQQGLHVRPGVRLRGAQRLLVPQSQPAGRRRLLVRPGRHRLPLRPCPLTTLGRIHPMAILRHDCVRGTLLGAALAVGAFALGPGSGRAEDSSPPVFVGLGADPCGFKTAEEMYRVGDVREFDNEAAKLVRAFSDLLEGKMVFDVPIGQVTIGVNGAEAKDRTRVVATLKRGEKYTVRGRNADWVCIEVPVDGKPQLSWVSVQQVNLETSQLPAAVPLGGVWWEGLVRLNPYRKTAPVGKAVASWAEALAARIKALPTAKEDAAFATANDHYAKREFAAAANGYIAILERNPSHFSARNNLALAELYLGNDLAAQVALETLARAAPTYVPAKVNLTVVYERAGRRDDAKTLAAELLKERRNVSTVAYNAAWYANLDGQYAEADRLLRPLAQQAASPLHTALAKLNTSQMGASQPTGFWEEGLAGVCGGKESTGGWIVAGVLFFVSALIAIALAAAGSLGNKGGAFFLFLLIGGGWAMVFWGIPTGGWWALFVLYGIVGGGFAAGSAES
jgi:hypothetical protein